MDHIWGARSGLKKSLALLFLKNSAIILRQDFLKTLYFKQTSQKSLARTQEPDACDGLLEENY